MHNPASVLVVTFDRQLIVGFSLSSTVIVKLHVAVLPAASVTLYVSVVVPTGNVEPLPSPVVLDVLSPVQLSVPTGVVYVITAPQVPASLFAVMLEGHEIEGSILSSTVIVKLHEAELAAKSVTVYVSVLVPSEKVLPLPDPEVSAVLCPVQLSEPLGAVYVTTASQEPEPAFTVILEGQLIVGFSLSSTVIVKLHEAVFPDASVTVYASVAVPTLKVDPLPAPDVNAVVEPLQLSVPVGAV